MDRKKAFAWLAGILILAAFLRIFYFFELQSSPVPVFTIRHDAFDQSRFFGLARDILTHHWLGSSVKSYAPGYSYLIAGVFRLFGEDIYEVFMFQMALGILVCFFLYRTATILFSHQIIGLVAAFMWAVYSPAIFYEGALLRASTIAFFNLLAFYFLVKGLLEGGQKRYIFLSGVAMGVSAVFRPNVLVACLAGYVFLAGKKALRTRIICTAAFVGGVVLVVAPITVRNRLLHSSAIISEPHARIFWIGNAYDAKGIGLSRTPTHYQLAKETEGKMAKMIPVFFREIQRHPKAYRSLYARKITMFFNGYEIPSNLSYDLLKEDSLALRLAFLDFSFLSPLALLGLFLTRRRMRQGGLLYLFLGILSGSVILLHVQSRYRMPAMPFFVLLGAYSLWWLWDRMSQQQWRALGAASAFLVFAAAWTHPDQRVIQRYFGSRVRFIDYGNAAFAYLDRYDETKGTVPREVSKKLLQRAEEFLKKAVERSPDYKRSAYLLSLALIYMERHEDKAACEVLWRILARQPGHETARRLLNRLPKEAPYCAKDENFKK